MPRLLVCALSALSLCALAGCDRGTSEPASDEPAEAAPVEAEAEESAHACALTRAVAQIESVRLESADGACRVFVPSAATPGELAVRVSAAGDDTAAAVELSIADQTLYATGGTVTLTAAGNGQWTGSLDAMDDAEPGTGRIRGTFDISGE